MLLEINSGHSLSLFKLNIIDMTIPVLATEATVVFKSSTDSKEGKKSEIDKGTQIEKLNQEFNTFNEEITCIIVKLESSGIESAYVLKIRFNKCLKKQMKVLI